MSHKGLQSGYLMRSFFSPAINVLNRLNYTMKFALMGLMSLVAVTVVVYALFASLNQTIHTSQRQLQGLALIKPVSRTIQAIQQHRGISAALFSGNGTMQDRRAAKEAEIDETLGATEKMLPPSLTTSEDFRRIRENWGRLRKEGLQWTVDENFIAHTRLIEQLQLFEEAVADDYMLTLDSELASSYLIDAIVNKLPHTFEHLGQLRAFGTGILSRKQISESEKVELKAMVDELDHTLKPLNTSIERIVRHNPALRNTLSALPNDIAVSAQKIIDHVASDILTDHFATSPVIFLDLATAEIDRGYAQMHATLLPTTEALIKTRIARAEGTLYTSIGIALLLFLIVAYFAVGNYYTIIVSIRSFARAARAFAGGNLNTRVRLDTRDELSQIGDSFNKMVDGFSSMLAARDQAEAAMRVSVQKHRLLFESSRDALMMLTPPSWKFTGANQATLQLFGASSMAEFIALAPWDVSPERQPDRRPSSEKSQEMIATAMREGSHFFEWEHQRLDGQPFTADVLLTRMDVGKDIFLQATVRDITERKQAEKKMLYLANYDALTGLPNRTLFHDRLAQEVRKAHRTGLKMALLFIDLDKFKEVNDTLGHGMGDILLQEAARRIGGCVREADTMARLGGDEFTVILAELDHTGSVERATESIRQALAEPFLLGEETAYVSASIGVTLYPDDATAAEDLIKNAEQAMYAAKHAGRNRLSYFTPALEQAAQSRLYLLNDLRIALAGGQFRVYFQPIVNLATGCIDKAEALIRWQHPQRGIVSPAQFITLAEETGLIIEIGDWVFRETAQQVKRWRALYNPMLQISVNKSPMQFRQSGTTHEVWLDYLRELGLPGQSIAIEITEGLLLDAESSVTNKLFEFRDAGMQVSIDDFGTGYSSLAYLKKFDIDYLKIDQSFVRDLVTDPNDRALSEAIIVMAHKLGLKVIAEGVETEAQRALLVLAGCDYAQGYLFSRPVPAEEFEVLLKKQPSDLTPHIYPT